MTPGSQTGSLSSSLNPGGVPQLVTLSLLTPSLTPAPGAILTPTPLFTPSPLALGLPIPLAAAATPATLKPVKPAAYVPAANEDKSVPALLTPIRDMFKSDAPEGLGKMDDAALIELSKRMFGESSRPDGMLKQEKGEDVKDKPFRDAYLRFDAPFSFDRETARRYEEALGFGTTNEDRAKKVVDEAAALLTSAGVTYARSQRTDDDGRVIDRLQILPDREGGALNRLAWNIQQRHGAAVEYAPRQLGYGSNAGFVPQLKTVFLPHFGTSGAFFSILHEAQHSNYLARRVKGDLSPFSAMVVSRLHQTIVPRASHYASQMSMEELTTHAKGLKLMLAEARRKAPSSWESYMILSHAYELHDLRRSALILAGRILTELEEGSSVVPVTDEKALAILGPLSGAKWMAIALPWSVMYMPVPDEEPATPKKGLAKLFSRKPPTPGQKAASRTAKALKEWAALTSPALGEMIAELEKDAPDWNALNALADTLALAGAKTEKSFKAAR